VLDATNLLLMATPASGVTGLASQQCSGLGNASAELFQPRARVLWAPKVVDWMILLENNMRG
jgi:hypothetical protein